MCAEDSRGCGEGEAASAGKGLPMFADSPGGCCDSMLRSDCTEPRVSGAMVDFVYPEVVFPSSRMYAIAGEGTLRTLVHRHHELLKQSDIGHLFPREDEKAYGAMVQKITDFVVETCGGPRAYTAVHGAPSLRSRHFPFAIDEHAREVWLALYKQALKEVGFPKQVLAEYWEWIEALSVRMINRRTTTAPITRIPFESIAGYFG